MVPLDKQQARRRRLNYQTLRGLRPARGFVPLIGSVKPAGESSSGGTGGEPGGTGGSGSPARKLRILLVDDNVAHLKTFGTLLRRGGHHVVIAANGAEAVLCAESGFDVILMDLHMPVMDGLQATRTIRANERRYGGRTPIWAFTSADTESDQRLCVDAGMDGFISKTIRAASLERLLQGFVRSLE
jgi:CheY-like chemotaxis protein